MFGNRKQHKEILDVLDEISKLRSMQLGKSEKDHHVILYASGFLQNPVNGAAISEEDVDGFMSAFSEVEATSLTLLLHTPGGNPYAVETIVEYLHTKCGYIEVIVPVYAMSGGAAICLASDHIIMSQAGQLGPFDMQLGEYSARMIKESFDRAVRDIQEDAKMAYIWAPILQSMDYSAVVDAEKSLSYMKQLVNKWLVRRGLLSDKARAEKITAYFNAEPNSGYGQIHLHGQRIDLDKLHEMELNVKALEDSENLEGAVMDAYWLMADFFKQAHDAAKFIASSKNGIWTGPTLPED